MAAPLPDGAGGVNHVFCGQFITLCNLGLPGLTAVEGTAKLGKIPEEQEQFQMECGGYLFDVAEVADKMIRKVRVTKIQEKEQTTENE